MEYNDALRTLNRLHRYRLEIGQQRKSVSAKIRTAEWLELLGINEEKLQFTNFIHVAGTKGKGTTCLYCESMLSKYKRMKGIPLKIGCLTSPHVSNIRERIRLDSAPISEQLFAAHFSTIWAQMVWHAQQAHEPSMPTPAIPGYPGFLTLLAIYTFVQEKVDIAIIETGIGGENDSTNVIPRPRATGIVNIGLDHVNILGNELSEIAWHKAGIFKKDSPAFTVPQDESVIQVLQERAIEKRISGKLCVVPEHLVSQYGVTVDPDMPFQRHNASLAIALTEAYLKQLDPAFSMSSELASSLEKTKLPGRSDIVRQGKLEWYISSAHNELSIEVASTWFKEMTKYPRNSTMPRILIFSHESHRDSILILEPLCKALYHDGAFKLDHAIFCSAVSGIEEEKLDFIDPRREGATPTLEYPKRHAERWKDIGGSADATIVPTVKDAIDRVRSKYTCSGAMVFIVGSVYQAGAASVVLAAK